MRTHFTNIVLIVFLTLVRNSTTSDIMKCMCELFLPQPWSECTATCGGGTRVWEMINHPMCWPYFSEECAAYQRKIEACNTFCQHGGNYVSVTDLDGYCQCPKGHTGTCCEQRGDWEPWSECTASCGGGIHSREFVLTSKWCSPLPEGCDLDTLKWEQTTCNTFCQHGGHYVSVGKVDGHCQCSKGHIGTCCVQMLFKFVRVSLTLDACGCDWGMWESWSDCSVTCGGGTRFRDREYGGLASTCDVTGNCGFNDLRQEKKLCNTYCQNGGNYVSLSDVYGHCQCSKGQTGPCCERTVTCGEPSSINHGTYTGTTFTYNNRVTYHCDKDFNMTDGSDVVRTCTEYGTWSGSSPVCLYAKSCTSSPCRNGATCVNLLGDFRCVCQEGWDGKICEIDIQPPIFTGCPSDRTKLTSNLTSYQTWVVPNVTDPHQTEVHLTGNYPTNHFEFPWGEYSVLYSAVKPSNGLTAECRFTITVKPHPCQQLVAPEHGMVMCNNWRTEYARVCTYACFKGFSLPPGYTGIMFNCGATGNWLPSQPLQRCFPHVLREADKNESSNEINDIATCNQPEDREKIATFYINNLKSSEFNGLCLDHIDKCTAENVEIKC